MPRENSSAPAGRSDRRLLVVDGANTLYRAFFAVPGLRAPDGTPTGAVYGFTNMLLKLLREERPDAVVVVFDARGKTFRHRLYDDYKATRDAQPEDLSIQFPLAREVVEALSIPVLEVEDFEADDVIATLVRRADADTSVEIVSTDRDLMQLVDDRVALLDGIRDRRYGPREVEERFGVPPDRILDLRALVGDTSDNIPGVKGIGEKGAARLLRDFRDLENLIAHRDEIPGKRAREALAGGVDDARLSKRLATLRFDVPLPAEARALDRREPDRERLRALFTRLGFARLLESAELVGEGPPDAAASPARVDVDVVRDAGALDGVVGELTVQPFVALAPVLSEGGPLRGTPVGLALACGAERAAYVPLAQPGRSLFDDGRALAVDDVVERLRGLLDGPGAVAWVAADTKEVQILCGERGLELPPPYFDVGLAGLLVDGSGSQGTAALVEKMLGGRHRTWEELAGRGAKAVAAADLALAELADWAAHEVCAVRSLVAPLAERLDRDGLTPLFEEVELPLTSVLARMERTGVRVDETVLAELSSRYESELAHIEAEIYRIAGERFLISSPKQLQQILFEKLKLPAVKKTKTGYSTSEDVLEQLASQHELPMRILAYRRLAKLKNTYIDALPPLVHPATGRIHPTFHQIGAATGRLSAANPNVQNIPIRTEEGVRIREAFVPASGCLLLSADYSQVELRILAHYSEDENLIDAFRRGEDIHRRTAAEVAGIDPEAVTPDQRARAKAVNFGIIYGLSAFGLANQLGIATGEAQATIDAYFGRYRGVRRFIEETIAGARERGYVVTRLGRRRYLPDLASRNRALRSAAERMAVNTVIQGTAADLIKKAMVEVDRGLREEGLTGRMILQVHDELVFEAPADDVGAVGPWVRARMEGVLALRVPLVVDVGTGRSWREAH